MAKYQQGFPVNENGEIVVSGTNQNVVGVLPIDVLPVDDSGGLKLGKVATLATDAAGNAVGLSGGSPASGVPFGPPTTIFRLRMRCSGGSAVVSVVATKRSGGSDTFNFSLSSGGDVSEPMYADDYSSLVWTKTGTGAVTLEVI
jgi:hypothetical protein